MEIAKALELFGFTLSDPVDKIRTEIDDKYKEKKPLIDAQPNSRFNTKKEAELADLEKAYTVIKNYIGYAPHKEQLIEPVPATPPPPKKEYPDETRGILPPTRLPEKYNWRYIISGVLTVGVLVILGYLGCKYIGGDENGETAELGQEDPFKSELAQLRQLFKNCKNEDGWKRSAETSLGRLSVALKINYIDIEVFIKGGYRLGNISEFLNSNDFCDYTVDTFLNQTNESKTYSQLIIDLRNKKNADDLICDNAAQIKTMAESVVHNFYTRVSAMGDNSVLITSPNYPRHLDKRISEKNNALALFVDENRKVEFIPCESCPKVYKAVSEYLQEEFIELESSIIRAELNLVNTQLIELRNLEQSTDGKKFKGSMVIYQSYKKYLKQETPNSDLEYKEVLGYQDITKKTIDIFGEFVSCFNNGDYTKRCCIVLLGDISAEKIIVSKR